MQTLVTGLLWLSAIGCGLLAGLYFAFSAFVMTALGRIDQAAGIAAMNEINRVIVQSLFLPVFMGSTLTCFVLAVLALYNRIVHSPFGQVLRAIRNNPERAKSLGYNVDRFKIASFTLSAALSGFAASLKTVIFGIATLTDVSTVVSTEVVLINLVGGIGTIFGPVVGSYVILSLEHFLSPYGPWVLLIQGVVFMLFVLVFRQCIVGELQKRLKAHL